MAIIKYEFVNLYRIKYQEGTRGFPRFVRIANVHADFLTMGDLGLGQIDRDQYVRLVRMVLGCWEGWLRKGMGMEVFGEGLPLDLEDMYWDFVCSVRGLRE